MRNRLPHNIGDLLSRHEHFGQQFEPYNRYEVISGSAESLRRICIAIVEAEQEVAALFYSFENDEAGWPVAEALMTAASNGRRVRLAISSMLYHNQGDMYLHLPWRSRSEQCELADRLRAAQRMINLFRSEGVAVRVQGPFRFGLDRLLWPNHSKLVIVDPEVNSLHSGFLGAVNPTAPNSRWHDFMVKTSGDMINGMWSIFEAAWAGGWPGRGLYEYSGGALIADTTGFGVIYPIACELIRRSKQPIVLQSPYIQGKRIWQELALAAQERHLPVTVIVPHKNHKQFGAPSEKRLNWAVQSGIAIYRFTGNDGMTHARVLLADGWVLCGSCPFNQVLAGRMSETCILTRSASLLCQLETFLSKDIAGSQQHVAR